MNELIQSVTALPNLHPALVHFPIGLLPVALLFDLLGVFSRQRWLVRGGALLWALAALATGAAYWAGKQEAVRVAVPAEGNEGLGLVVDGRAMLLLPGTFGDVQLDAVVDLSAFDGTFGLVHHAQSADAAGLFSVSTSGSASLVVLENGSRKTLDEQPAPLLDRPVELAVSSSGRHLKGLVDGKTVTHGHVAPGEAGGCGLLLDGSGSVGIITLRLTPLT